MRISTVALLAALGSASLAVPSTVGQPAQAAPDAEQPNIVFVLMDDFSSELMQYMDGLSGFAERGVSFSTYVTSDPLCCPSRASILTGKYPHNTGVLNNQWPAGGMSGFLAGDNEEATVGYYLDQAGYRTGLMGKYLNGYKPKGGGGEGDEPAHPAKYVPPGWDEWFATGAAYQEFAYDMVSSVDGNAEIVRYKGADEDNYLTDVLSDRAVDFIDRNADEPFFLMVAPFATHGNAGDLNDPEGADGPDYPPAPRDRPDRVTRPAGWTQPDFAGGDCGNPTTGGCADVAFPDPSWGETFNTPPKHAPAWYGPRPRPMKAGQVRRLEESHLERVQMVQAADDLLTDIEAAVNSAGVADDTYVVFAADNGYHLGQHALGKGKSTAYDSDVITPMIVMPPGGLPEPQTVPELIQNTDFFSTFLTLAGETVPLDADGRSFAWALDGTPQPPAPRKGAIVEFNGEAEGAKAAAHDPDREEGSGATPTKYFALRTADYLYVDYSKMDTTVPRAKYAEFYDLTVDPWQLNNIYRTLTDAEKTALNTKLRDYTVCSSYRCVVEGLTVPPLPQ